MSTNGTDLPVHPGGKASPRVQAWTARSAAETRAEEPAGSAARKAWAEAHHAPVATMGGRPGKTRKAAERGIEDGSNAGGALMVVRAESHAAAARLLDRHPHFAIFPGTSVTVGLPE